MPADGERRATDADARERLSDRLGGSRWKHGLPLSSFEALIRIAHSENFEIGTSELAERVLRSPSRVSRLVIELEQLGLVKRTKSETDSRSTQVEVPSKGLAKLHEVAPTYLATIRSTFLDRLSQQDIEELARLWQKLGVNLPS